MNCSYCGYFNETETSTCLRCGSPFPAPACNECERPVAWGVVTCDRCLRLAKSADKTPCPSCGTLNLVSAEYCTACGTPMAVITRVMMLSRAREREPLETWRVYGIETRLVGRERELQELQRQYRAVVDDGTARVVLLTAPIGLGKSRLFDEFERRLNEAFTGSHTLQAASRDDAGGPYSMFSRMVRDRFYIGEKEHPDSARSKLLDAVRSLIDGEDAERVAHYLGLLLDLHFEDSPHLPAVRDTEGAQDLDRRAHEALAEVLRADAAGDPLVIFLDDLQYATRRSLDLVDYLTRALRDTPVLFILSWNPDEIVSNRVLYDIEADAEIELTPLSDAEVEQFVRDTLHKAAHIPDRLVDKITESAHGNPLSVEEVLRILISQGIIDTRRSTWTIDEKKIDTLTLPSTMEGAVQARLGTLTKEEREVLEMAACVGTVFWPAAVHCLYHLAQEQAGVDQLYWQSRAIDQRCDELLESLERKDMIRRAKEDDGLAEMYFKHRLERSKVYDGIAGQVKQRYHRLLAQWIERSLDGDDETIAEVCAMHFDRARCLEQAAVRYTAAADLARERYANEKAVELYLKGLSYLSDADIDLKLATFLQLGNVYHMIGQYDQALAYFREMLRYAWLLGDEAKGGVAYNKIGRAYSAIGEYDLALEHFGLAMELFRAENDERGIASTMDDQGKIEWMRGNFDEAEKFYNGALRLRREIGDLRSIALSLSHTGALKMQQGRIQPAMSEFREALELRRKVGDHQGMVDSYNSLAVLCLERGQQDHALTLFSEALELARKIGYRGSLAVVLNNLGEVYLLSGDVRKAQGHLEEAMHVAEDSGERRALFDILRNLGRVALKRSNRDLALERLNEALQIAQQLDSQIMVAAGMQSLAQLHANFVFDPAHKEESIRLAEQSFGEALELLRGIGNEGELGRCLASYGQFLVEIDRRNDGREQLQEAQRIFDELDMKVERSNNRALLSELT